MKSAEVAQHVVKKAYEALEQAMKNSGSSRGDLGPQSVCRICWEEARKLSTTFDSCEFGRICGTVGSRLGVTPKTESWPFFAMQAMTADARKKRRFQKELNVKTGEINVDPEDDDDEQYIHDYGDDLSTIDPATINGPTRALAGTEEKIRTLILRVKSGAKTLWVEGDHNFLD